MNILIFSWRGPGHPNAGGAELSTHEHARGWVNSGHNVTLFTSFFKDCKEYDFVDGIRIIRRGRQIFGVQWEAFKWYLFGNHSKFDLIIDQFHGIPFFTPLYVRRPKLVFIHEVAKEVWTMNPWKWPFNLIPAFIGTFFEPLIFKTLYKKITFMTVSKSTKDDLMEWDIPERNITVVHNGFNRLNYPKSKKGLRKTITYLGALSKDKGIEDALNTFRNLNEKDKNMQFWVIGKGESHYLDYLKNMTKKLGIEKIVKFWGFINEREKYSLLSRTHILINPSIREGWGLVVIEAASVGTPTVGYNVAGLKDSVIDGKTGFLCDPNPQSCAQKVTNLLENKETYDFMSNNCINWSKKFSWDKASKQSLNLLERISKK